jgi:hypothetical protein
MILARLWIVQHEFTISEFGAFDRGRTDDAKSSPTFINALMMTLNWVRTILFFLLPMNASSFLDSHFVFHKNKLYLTLN